jgi:O-methyltransferase
MIDKIHGYGYKETFQHTHGIAKNIEVEGDFVECGVAYGGQLAAMHFGNPTRTVWGFDSFEGIPLGCEKDKEQPGIGKPRHDQSLPIEERLVSSGITVHTLEGCEDTLKGWGVDMTKINLVKAWFQNIKRTKVKDIAILRLDADMYESTLVCLELFYKKVVKGGYVIIDDWNLEGCRTACYEYFGKDFKPELTNRGVAYFVK